ncbi:MAG: TolC family protein [Gammaproteobacteria bacterium]|nr:TolC family protein [Gammaproteobacteria bacterium]MBU1653650.1 TolC family protein [Gammaproteobacteria bacterium]MBU1962018.1 TolC family protein [Gammaproteobacteria bacterium]
MPKLIGETTGSHPQIRAQREAGRAAEADMDTAKWQFLPTPSASVEGVRAESDDPNYRGDDRVTTLRLQQPLFAGGRLISGYKKADATEESKEAAIDEAAQQLALQTVQAYGDWLTADGKEAALQNSLGEHQRLLSQITQRASKGKSAEVDKVLASSRLQQTTAELAVARIQGASALARLSQLLGRSIGAAELVRDPSRPLQVPGSAEALIDQAEERSPELKRVQATAQAQKAEIGVQRAALLPEAYLRLEQQDDDFSVKNAGSHGRVFVGLQTNFGAGLSSVSRVSAAKARHAEAQAELESSRRKLTEQILTDAATHKGLQTLQSALQNSLAAARDVHASYKRQYDTGLKTWLDVMNAAREVAHTETQLADARGSLLVVSWRLAILSRGLDDVVR